MEEAFYSNFEKIADSDLFKAIQADVEMFGEDAFITRTDDDEDSH